MSHVDEFYDTYLLKYPDRANRTQRAVFVASDDVETFEQLKKSYPNYKYFYNDTFTKVAGNFGERYSQHGFESIIFDIYFLSKANYLVCTFSSNICRLAYELLVARVPDTYKQAKSLDLHYYNYFEMKLYQRTLLKNVDPILSFERGQLLEKYVYSGYNFDGYHWNGFSSGRLSGTKRAGDYPSYKAKDVYI